jgi:hypothetical protein
MEMEITALNTVTQETTPTPRIDNRDLRVEKAQKLKEMDLTREHLHAILPVSTLDKLIESTTFCVAPTKKADRCRIKLKHLADGAPDIFECLASLSVPDDWEAIFQNLKSLVHMTLCGSPHGKKAMEWLLALNLRMIKGAEKRDSGIPDTPKAVISTLVKRWLKDVCRNSDEKIIKLGERLAQRVKADDVPLDTTSVATDEGAVTSPSVSATASQHTTPDNPPEEIERISYIQGFRPYQPLAFKSLSVPQAVKKTLTGKLADPDLDSKYLYIYWFPGNFGYIKIGVSDNVRNRLSGWEEQCKHDIREHPQGASDKRVLVKHAYRVEKLVHTELKELRFEETSCKGCGRRHTEWFCCKPEHAAKVIKKYSDWAATMPYRLDRQRKNWILNEGITESKIMELCQPIVPEESSTKVGTARRIIPDIRRRDLSRH